MNQPTHIIDPNGEVIIVLRNANAPSAPDDEEDTIADMDIDAKSETIEDVEEQPDEERPAKRQHLEEQLDEHAPLNETPEGECFRIQVSAKHMMLASPVLRSMLTGGWKESATYQSKGFVEITAESWDLEALLILLNAIHGKTYTVPQSVSLEMLAKIAVIIDYYDCKEVMHFMTNTWIEGLKSRGNRALPRHVTLWVWISWVFDLDDEIRRSTSTAMTCGDRCFSNRGLPIPESWQ
ncbi:hypothetical protein AbraIFM66951_011858 [Aspergillus brasiliensis]|uniref:BTB domain-containing protein n=1 Tax=Aspergillus brasiliensis TaxID=319629 RepID=A0A9W6DR65_9EURO|nr:hypothetical protein AbraCBS73388_011724 [Aspergillus brasiliensis]GKZ48103.1 hypothetical protein AbraIFM66951_011858 [Aspergillus brasiliensis]